MNTLFEESITVMREMIKKQVISPYPTSMKRLMDGPSSILRQALKQLSWYRDNREPSTWLHQQNTYQLPETRRYQVSSAPETGYTTQTIPASAWVVELARWPVPMGSFGIVKSLEQYLSVPTVQGPQACQTVSNNWGDPFVFDVPQIDWRFRLSSISQSPGPWIDLAVPTVAENYLPGIPYADLESSHYLWYPASSPAAHNLHLPIPGGWILRAFLLADPQTEDPLALSAALRLTGSIQSETNEAAQLVARTSW